MDLFHLPDVGWFPLREGGAVPGHMPFLSASQAKSFFHAVFPFFLGKFSYLYSVNLHGIWVSYEGSGGGGKGSVHACQISLSLFYFSCPFIVCLES